VRCEGTFRSSGWVVTTSGVAVVVTFEGFRSDNFGSGSIGISCNGRRCCTGTCCCGGGCTTLFLIVWVEIVGGFIVCRRAAGGCADGRSFRLGEIITICGI
jgi:hypothetical protein